MASQISDPMTVDPERISFEVQRMSITEPGRLEVVGRWFGVHGRSFVRPALILTMPEAGGERRALAELEHTPWAAQDGELWMAAFQVEVEPGDASAIALSVAPDITVTLPYETHGRRRGQALGARADRVPPVPAESAGPRALGGPASPRAAVALDLERLGAQLAAANQELERERAGGAARQRELRETERRRVQANAERDEAIRAKARAESALRERDIALDTASRALVVERAESGRLRAQLARARTPPPQRAVSPEDDPGRPERERPPPPAAPAARPEPAPERPPLPAAPAARPEPKPERPPPPAASAARPEPERSPHPAAPAARPHTRPPAPSRRAERPLNPSLRSRTNWFGRLLVLLILLGVIAAIVLLVRTTVS
jgi:hypothetical protein